MTAKLEQALIQYFIDSNFGLPNAWENKDFEPTAGEAYAEIKTVINDETAFSMNTNDQTDGYMQIILRYPEDKYSWDAKNKADEIKRAFRIGLRLQIDGERLTISRKKSGEGFNEAGWYKIVVRVFFNAVIPRN